MKKYILPLFLLILVVGWFAFETEPVDFKAETEGGIHFFQGSIAEALKKAKAENKIVFVDVYATWCGPCKRLKTKTFSEKKVGDFFNSRFINLAIDGETQEGRKVMENYSLNSYPTLLFLKPNGEVLDKALGFHSPSELISIGEKQIH